MISRILERFYNIDPQEMMTEEQRNVLNYCTEIVQEVAKEYGNASNNDLTVVSALPSLYPMQPFEEEAIHRVVASAKDGSWIPCSERLPEVETEVLIHARRKFRDGSFKDIITTAMYEDGTVRENDSSWGWEDIDGEWDEEEECWIVPKGWWENKHYNPDGVLNNEVDDEVIEWMPLPAYQKGEQA